MNVAWRNSDWHKLDSRAIPTFYVFRHGELVDPWNGWPANTVMHTLPEYVTRNGLPD